MKKKLLSILLVLSLMLALVPAAFAAGDVSAELESDGTTLTFSGSGVATADCWNGDWTAVTHIALGFEIRGVAEDVLARCVNLVSFETIKGSWYLQTYNGGLISEDGKQMLAAPNRCTAYEIPDLVQTVKTGAFRYCQGLTAVTFPASLTTIEAQAFTSCLNLTAAALPDGLKTIGDFAFAGCAALTSVLIPKSVTSIGAGAFTGCTALTAINYSGTEAEWAQLTKGENALPEGVTVNCNAPIHHYGFWKGTYPSCTTEGQRTRTDRDAQARNRDLLDMQGLVSRFEQKKLSADMEEKQILDKLWDNYELSRTAAEALRQPIENMTKANRQIAELRRNIGALGTPNLGAIDEFTRVNTRYTFLTGQRDDILKAKRELTGIISDVTGEMEGIFTTQFQAIDQAFRQTFLELFGGGKAALVLEDPEHVLDSGIEIKVQPPGKALSTLSLMSGGEMAFVAIALYFAILKVRPTPFCVMDEIEAALDEANVTRYVQYMRRLAKNTQFLVITHRRGTMEEADHLFGVTMQEKGVSRVIELSLDEAAKTIS